MIVPGLIPGIRQPDYPDKRLHSGNCSTRTTCPRRLYDLGGTAEKYDEVIARSAHTLYELRTGGKAVSRRSSLFVLTGQAEGVGEPFWWEYAPDKQAYEIPYTDVILGSLGQLGSDGKLYRVLPDNETYDVTPTVLGIDYYTYGAPGASKHKLVHLTECTALTNPDNTRTTVGVGEYVNFSFDPPINMSVPETPHWETTAGSVDPTTGEGTKFTAPSNDVPATVTVHVRDVKLETKFSVKEPSVVDTAHTYKVYDYTNFFGTGVSGAGMYLRVYVAPTDVSFYRVQCMEVAQDATSISGYFADTNRYPNPPADLAHNQARGANEWFQINADNSWEYTGLWQGRDWDRAWWGGHGQPWYPGTFTWIIPGQWKIDGGPTNDIANGWDQRFTLQADGTMKIKKFGKEATRHPSAP